MMAPEKRSGETGDQALELNPNGLKTELASLVVGSSALSALIITKGGNLVAQAGNTTVLDPGALAALIAGMFSATREVARMLGERHFSILLQQGERRHLHISLVSATAMMVVIFEGYERIGRVRLAARAAGERLGVILDSSQPATHPGLETPQFKEVALDLIDRIFDSSK